MTKLGVHVSSGDRYGFGQFLSACSDSGHPIPVVFAVDQDVTPDIKRYSPSTLAIYRHQPVGTNGNPPGFLTGDPRQCAVDWLAKIIPNWRLNPSYNFYAPINEPGFGTAIEGKWLNAFMFSCMQIAEAAGFKLALYGFSAGNPSDDSGLSLEQRWNILADSMQWAKAHGHILILHEYGLGPSAGNPGGLLRTSKPYLACRYRRTYAALKSIGGDVPIVISECGPGAGGLLKNTTDWLLDVEWYDQELQQDDYMIGCGLYQAGSSGPENISPMFGLLAQYIINGSPLPVPPPVPPVPPPQEGAQYRTNAPVKIYDTETSNGNHDGNLGAGTIITVLRYSSNIQTWRGYIDAEFGGQRHRGWLDLTLCTRLGQDKERWVIA